METHQEHRRALFGDCREDRAEEIVRGRSQHQNGPDHFQNHARSTHRGEQHGRSKLTVDDVMEIRRRSDQGENSAAIAGDFGVNPSTVRRILKGVTWTHV